MFRQIRVALAQIPKDVVKFLLKALTLLVLWKVLYLGYLKPNHSLDAFLTRLTAKGTAGVLDMIFPSHSITLNSAASSIIRMDGQEIVFIMDPCNALELYILYAGFILCIPNTWKKMLLYIAGGITGIFILNIIRCTALAYLNYIHYNYVDVAHHYIFSFAVYTATFISWMQYMRTSKINEVNEY